MTNGWAHAARFQFAGELVERVFAADDFRGAEEFEALHGCPFRRSAAGRDGLMLRDAD